MRNSDDFAELAHLYTDIVEAPGSTFPFLVSLQDRVLSRVLLGRRDFDLDIMDEAIRALTTLTGIHPVRHRHLIDVGANIGTTSVYAVTLYEADHVTAIEPSPTNVKLARCNAILHDVADQITIYDGAATNFSGRVDLGLSATHLADHRVVTTGAERIGQYTPRAGVVSVRAVKLDELDLDPASIGLIWIDTQGHEGHVLDGAQELLVAGPPLMLEYAPEMLQRAGGLDLFDEVLARYYTHFGDGEDEFRARPIADLPSLRSSYQGRGSEHARGEGMTDLIVWRSGTDSPTPAKSM
jgi:FkbM family methyltransferase